MSLISRVPSRRWGNDEGANDVLGDHAAGVADDVGIARFEPEHAEDVNTRVHADHNGEFAGRRAAWSASGVRPAA